MARVRAGACVRARARVCVRVCAGVHAQARVRARVCACVRGRMRVCACAYNIVRLYRAVPRQRSGRYYYLIILVRHAGRSRQVLALGIFPGRVQVQRGAGGEAGTLE